KIVTLTCPAADVCDVNAPVTITKPPPLGGVPISTKLFPSICGGFVEYVVTVWPFVGAHPAVDQPMLIDLILVPSTVNEMGFPCEVVPDHVPDTGPTETGLNGTGVGGGLSIPPENPPPLVAVDVGVRDGVANDAGPVGDAVG